MSACTGIVLGELIQETSSRELQRVSVIRDTLPGTARFGPQGALLATKAKSVLTSPSASCILMTMMLSSELCCVVAIGDVVLSVDGCEGTRDELREMMKGSPGTSCTIALRGKLGVGKEKVVKLMRGEPGTPNATQMCTLTGRRLVAELLMMVLPFLWCAESQPSLLF